MSHDEFFRLLIQRIISSSALRGIVLGLSESWDWDYGDYYHQGLKIFSSELRLWVSGSYDGNRVAIFDNAQPVPAYSIIEPLMVVGDLEENPDILDDTMNHLIILFGACPSD